jgi:predicted peroxiredoxin
MSLHGKKLGILLSCRPDQPNFVHGLGLAQSALEAGCQVYLYCIDDAVSGASDARMQSLKARGLKLYACAYGAHRRHIALNDDAVFAGLTVVNDLVAGTDRFVSFN